MNYQRLGARMARFMWGPGAMPLPALTRPPVLVPPEYLSLYKYLDGRYADTVVLTFQQIEDLLGFALPDPARLHSEWWSTAEGATPSMQSRSWTGASRTAVPNLAAQIVVFDRGYTR